VKSSSSSSSPGPSAIPVLMRIPKLAVGSETRKERDLPAYVRVFVDATGMGGGRGGGVGSSEVVGRADLERCDSRAGREGVRSMEL